jgi:hypothetical protein
LIPRSFFSKWIETQPLAIKHLRLNFKMAKAAPLARAVGIALVPSASSISCCLNGVGSEGFF